MYAVALTMLCIAHCLLAIIPSPAHLHGNSKSCTLSDCVSALFVSLQVLLLGVLFGGFLANKGSIPVWLRWISYLSVFR